MEVFVLQQAGSQTRLIKTDLPIPQAAAGEVTIAVTSAGVTPTELIWYPSTHTKDGGERTQAVPGHEFSGVVAAVGDGVRDLAPGDEVFGMNDWFGEGATAEFCVASVEGIIRKPAAISHSAAAATPISALTAWQGLIERAKIQTGERVLIVGASGSVGLMAVQFAATQGCHVYGVAAAEHTALLESLGCEQVLDYKSAPFEEQLRDLDVVFDTVGGDTLQRAHALLRPGGRMVTIAADAEGHKDPLIESAFFIVEPSAPQLKHVAELISNGTLRVFVKTTVPFDESPRAYLDTFAGVGKLVINVAER